MMGKGKIEPLFYLEELREEQYSISSRDARTFRDLLQKGNFNGGLTDFLVAILPCYLLPIEEPENDI